MGRRENLIEALKGLDEPFVEDAGCCVAGFDLDVATRSGAGTACCQWGSTDVEGPVHVTKTLRKKLAGKDDPKDLDEDEVELFRAMIRAKCTDGRKYYYARLSEDGDPTFSTSYDKIHGEWVAWAIEGTELTVWEDMADEDLEQWAERLDVDVDEDE